MSHNRWMACFPGLGGASDRRSHGECTYYRFICGCFATSFGEISDYYCVAAERETVGKQLCCIFGGVTVEQAVVEAVLDALAPARMEAMLEAAEQLATRRTEKQRQIEMELERARYEADRCGRQYSQVEPDYAQSSIMRSPGQPGTPIAVFPPHVAPLEI
jgi:hypothetical protein